MNKFIPLSKKHAILFVTNNIPNVSLPSLMNVEEISDGNLNIVYRISDPTNKKSYIVKQAPPYIRIKLSSMLSAILKNTVKKISCQYYTLMKNYQLS